MSVSVSSWWCQCCILWSLCAPRGAALLVGVWSAHSIVQNVYNLSAKHLTGESRGPELSPQSIVQLLTCVSVCACFNKKPLRPGSESTVTSLQKRLILIFKEMKWQMLKISFLKCSRKQSMRDGSCYIPVCVFSQLSFTNCVKRLGLKVVRMSCISLLCRTVVNTVRKTEHGYVAHWHFCWEVWGVVSYTIVRVWLIGWLVVLHTCLGMFMQVLGCRKETLKWFGLP